MAVAATIMLTGCAAQGGQKSPPLAASSSATPSAGSTANARETGLVAPEQVFGGDCDKLFSAQEVSTALGAAVTRVEEEPHDFDQLRAEQLGGINCVWRASESSQPYSLVWALAFPQGAVNTDSTSGCEQEFEQADGEEVCWIDTEQNGIRLSALIMGNDPAAAGASAAQDALSTLFIARSEEATAALAPVPASGAWASPVDCATLVASVDFSGVSGLGAGSTGEGVGGRGGYVPAAIMDLHGADQLPGCEVLGESASATFFDGGGMRWKGAELSAGATALDVEGLDTVLISAPSNGLQTVDVLDGPNWLRFSVKFVSNAPAIAQSLVAALDATATP